MSASRQTPEIDYVTPETIIPTTEVEIRRDYAIKIEQKVRKYYKDFKMNHVQLLTILTVPLFQLQPGDVAPGGRNPNDKKKQPKLFDNANQDSQDPESSYFPTNDKGVMLGGQDEKVLCRQRDNFKCVFLKTAEGDVAHVIPQSWNNTQGNMEKTLRLIESARLFAPENNFNECESLFADENNLGSSDKCWNILYYNKQLHWYYNHIFIGLKCLGIKEEGEIATVTIQHNWLYRTKNDIYNSSIYKVLFVSFTDLARRVVLA